MYKIVYDLSKKYFFLTFLHILCHNQFGGLRAPGAKGGKKWKKGAGKDKDRRAKTKEQGREGPRNLRKQHLKVLSFLPKI